MVRIRDVVVPEMANDPDDKHRGNHDRQIRLRAQPGAGESFAERQEAPGKAECQDRDWNAQAGLYTLTRLSRRALPITETELKLMAAAAIIGLSRMPKKG